MYIKYIETTYYNMGHGLIMGNIILKRQSYLIVSMECIFLENENQKPWLVLSNMEVATFNIP